MKSMLIYYKVIGRQYSNARWYLFSKHNNGSQLAAVVVGYYPLISRRQVLGICFGLL